MYEAEIARAYGAKDVSLSPIRDGQGGAQVLEAKLDGTRYALRISGPYLSDRPAWVEFEGELLAAAAAGSVSVSKARRGLSGCFGQAVEGRIALLTEWADGDIEWPTPPAKARLLGQAVARLHLATLKLQAASEQRPFDTAGLLDRPMDLLSEIVDPSPLTRFVEECRTRIKAIPRDEATFGPIHGDVHQGNCHFEGDRVTLFDFAQCGIGWRAFDLAGFLWPMRDDSIQRPELRAACEAYLAGYEDARPMLEQEGRAIPAFIRARDLWETAEWIATGDAKNRPDAVRETVETLAARWTAKQI